MENTLLQEMKKEYYIKIQEMEQEIENIKKNHKLTRKTVPEGKVSQLDAKYEDKIGEMTS